jgi:hypothetical protein
MSEVASRAGKSLKRRIGRLQRITSRAIGENADDGMTKV